MPHEPNATQLYSNGTTLESPWPLVRDGYLSHQLQQNVTAAQHVLHRQPAPRHSEDSSYSSDPHLAACMAVINKTEAGLPPSFAKVVCFCSPQLPRREQSRINVVSFIHSVALDVFGTDDNDFGLYEGTNHSFDFFANCIVIHKLPAQIHKKDDNFNQSQFEGIHSEVSSVKTGWLDSGQCQRVSQPLQTNEVRTKERKETNASMHSVVLERVRSLDEPRQPLSWNIEAFRDEVAEGGVRKANK